MITRACTPRDIAAVEPQPEQRADHEQIVKQAGVLASHFALAFWAERCIGVVGVAPLWPGCGRAWAVFSRGTGPYMPWITRRTRDMLDFVPYRRVETTTLCDFEAGNRWLLMLGFAVEAARMRSYDSEGRDHALYARVRS